MSFLKATDKSEKIPKLRTSCDACLQAKTRCEKTGTACRRCLNQGISCQFSPSQRCGKPPRKSEGVKDSKTSRPKARDTSRMTSQRGSPEPSLMFSSVNYGMQPDMSLIASEVMDLSPDQESRIKTSNSPEQVTYRSDSVASVNNTPFGSIEDFWGFPEVETASVAGAMFADLGQSSTTSTLPHSALDFTYDTPPMVTDRCCEQDCTNQALTTLLSLYTTQYQSNGNFSSGSSTSSSPKSTIDAQNDYLQHCSTAIATIEQFLQCPRAVQGDGALVCAAIIYKTVSHLKAAKQPYNASTSSGTSTPMILSNDGSDPMLWQFEALRREEQTQAMMQQVNIFQKMSTLAQLSEALVARRAAAGTDEGAHEILLALTKSLRSQLRCNMKDMADMSSSIAESYQT